jgi:hypothetical protein
MPVVMRAYCSRSTQTYVLSGKTAFALFPPVHGPNLEGRQRVDSGPLASKPMVLTEENIRRTIWHGQPGLPRPLPLRRRQDRLPGLLADNAQGTRSRVSSGARRQTAAARTIAPPTMVANGILAEVSPL